MRYGSYLRNYALLGAVKGSEDLEAGTRMWEATEGGCGAEGSDGVKGQEWEPWVGHAGGSAPQTIGAETKG